MPYEKNNTRRTWKHHTDVAESVWTRYYEVKGKEAELHQEIEKSGAPGVPPRRGVQVSHTSSSNFVANWGSKRNIRWMVWSHSRVDLESRICYLSCWKLCAGVEFKHLTSNLKLIRWLPTLDICMDLKWAGCSGARRCAREEQGAPWDLCLMLVSLQCSFLTSQLFWVVWN